MADPTFKSETIGYMGPQNFKQLVWLFIDLIWAAIPVVATLAFLAFLWGLTKFISNAGSDKAVTEGKSLMKWGLIALFIMVTLWGIIQFLGGELGFTDFSLPLLPEKR